MVLGSWVVSFLSSFMPWTESSGLSPRGRAGGTGISHRSERCALSCGTEAVSAHDPVMGRGVPLGPTPVKTAAWGKYVQHVEGTLFSQLLFDLPFYKQLRQLQTKRLPKGRAHESLGGSTVDAYARILDRLALSPYRKQRKMSFGPCGSSRKPRLRCYSLVAFESQMAQSFIETRLTGEI